MIRNGQTYTNPPELIFGATSATNGRETFVVSCVNFFKTTQKSYFCAKYAINMQNLHDLYAAVTQNVVFTLFCRKLANVAIYAVFAQHSCF